jgi:serine/threonine protein kinase
MTDKLTSDAAREERLNEVLLAYVEERQAGRTPDRVGLLAAHPDLHTELESFFASHDEVERLAAPLRRPQKTEGDSRPSGPELGQLGDFRLIREIGRGGMGVVYEAEQISLRRQVALKVLPFAAAIDPRQLQRFRNESLAAAHLHHEHIVPVYAVGSERGVHYYAMQYIEGQSLASLIAALRKSDGTAAKPPTGTTPKPNAEPTGPYQAPEAPETQTAQADRLLTVSISKDRSSGNRRYFDWVAGLGRQAALALEHAHQLGIVHRDIKPANLLLDARGQLWVADFGLAQVSGDIGVTVTGELLGTLRYASPEQALGKKGLIDHRSDVYSLGATLYELLTLRPIFDGRDRHELLRQIAVEEPRPPRTFDRAIPVELETVVMKALAKEPDERYATAQELADDLQRYLEDRPIRARRPSLVEKTTKWARRHRSVVASAVVALLLCVAGLSAATVLTTQAYERERIKAKEAEDQRLRADGSLRVAQRTLRMIEQISEEELADQMPLQDLRRRLLETALGYYQTFIDQRGDDQSIREELEASQAHVRTILAELATLSSAFEYFWLREKSVQDDLALTPEQRTQLAEVDRKLWPTSFFPFPPDPKALEPKGPKRPGKELKVRDFERLPRDPKEREQERLAKAREQHTEVARILTPAQRQRFREIIRQLQGPTAFSQSEVAEALGLTSDQQERIRGLLKQANETMLKRIFTQDCGPNQPPEFAAEELKKTTQDRILQTLTLEQRDKWADMTGKPFEGNIRSGLRFFTSGFQIGPREWHGPDHHHKGGPGSKMDGPRPPGLRGGPPPEEGQ